MNHAMIDLETLDVKPSAVILSIGVVLFNENGIDEPKSVEISVSLKSCLSRGMTVSDKTIKFWHGETMKNNLTLFQSLTSQARELPDALELLSSWLIENKVVFVWGNSPRFDLSILEHAYQNCCSEIPWKFYNERCYRTVKSLYPEFRIDEPSNHTALTDAKRQARHLLRIATRHRIGL